MNFGDNWEGSSPLQSTTQILVLICRSQNNMSFLTMYFNVDTNRNYLQKKLPSKTFIGQQNDADEDSIKTCTMMIVIIKKVIV